MGQLLLRGLTQGGWGEDGAGWEGEAGGGAGGGGPIGADQSQKCSPPAQEIEECCEALRLAAASLDPGLGSLLVLPLHPSVGRQVQKLYETLEPLAGGPVRRVVITHWLADSAFSVGSVRHVIDTGMELRSVSGRAGGWRALLVGGGPPHSPCLSLQSQ